MMATSLAARGGDPNQMSWKHLLALVKQLAWREIASRYRGAMFGIVWSLLTPLLMLAVYTFVFGYVTPSRWTGVALETDRHATGQFAVILFSGLIVHQFLSEVLTAAPALVVSRPNYVKKVMFPIHVLPLVSTAVALFNGGVSLLVLLAFTAFAFNGLPVTVILVPLVVIPLCIMTLGFAWFLAAAGVYFRDIGLLMPPILTAALFLSPTFFPRTALPEWLQPYLSLNPLSIPVESFRSVVIFGRQPDWTALGCYFLAAICVAVLGERFFRYTRRGFADVL